MKRLLNLFETMDRVIADNHGHAIIIHKSFYSFLYIRVKELKWRGITNCWRFFSCKIVKRIYIAHQSFIASAIDFRRFVHTILFACNSSNSATEESLDPPKVIENVAYVKLTDRQAIIVFCWFIFANILEGWHLWMMHSNDFQIFFFIEVILTRKHTPWF